MKFQFYRYQDLRARSARLWIMLPFLMIGMAGTASAQYLGADECQGCHAAQYESWITSGHRFILMNGMQARHRPLPLPGGESWDDISFVVGGHKTRINYLDDQGYLIERSGRSLTEIPGVFIAGDVHDHTYRQAVTAAGAGCKAAIDAERWLEVQKAG